MQPHPSSTEAHSVSSVCNRHKRRNVADVPPATFDAFSGLSGCAPDLPVSPGIALLTQKRSCWHFKNLLSGPAIGQPLSPSEWRRLVPDQLSSKADLGGEETGGSAVLNMYLRAMLETRP